MTHTNVIEYAPFELADGVSQEQLLTASDEIEKNFLSNYDGYVSRKLVRKDEKNWADIVVWRSAGDAQKAMQDVMNSEAFNSYFACMKMEEGVDPAVLHFDVIKEYSV